MTYDSIHPILDWIAAHPTWAGIAVFLISLSESLAIVGLVVPGVVMMTAIGAMMGGGVLPFWETLLWAILGAIAGDGISYWLGYHYHEHLRDFWPFKQFPQLLARGENFFKDHGGKSIIFGRFVGPVRPMIPVIAGMMDMPPRKFLFFNIVSAIAWAPLYSLPGILIGASLGTLSPEIARRIVVIILIFLLVLWLIYIFLIKLGSWIGSLLMHSVNRLWLRVSNSAQLRWLHKLLKTSQGTEEAQLGIFILGIFFFSCFIITTYNAMHLNGIALLNEPIYQLFRALHVDHIVGWMTLLTALGEPTLITLTGIAIAAFMVWRKRNIAALCWFFTVLGGNGIGYIVRQIVAMPRPDGLIYLSHHYSYPSGHALSSTLAYGLAAALIHPSLEKNHRYIPWLIVIPLILFISFSRVYLGIHWFIDIIGGIFLGIGCVAFGVLFYRRYESKSPRLRSILIPGLLTLSLGMGYYAWQIYPEKRREFSRHWTVKEFNSTAWWNDEATMDRLYRSGTLKQTATVFNIQWLDSLPRIQAILEKLGFKISPKLTIQSALLFLQSKATPNVPVLPKFHRDRLPVLIVTKTINNHERLVLQFWQSDYINEEGLPLWVGTFRIESEKSPLPFVSLYQENEVNNQIVGLLTQTLSTIPDITFQILSKDSSTEILLIKHKEHTK